jgi:hypothetical protein
VSKKPRNVALLRTVAERVCIRVLQDLRAGRIEKVDFNTLRAAVFRDPDCPDDAASRGELISVAMRRVNETALDSYRGPSQGNLFG